VPAATRARVLERDGHRCRFCGTRAGLHLHHIHLRSHGVDHQPHNLITLCSEHHDLVHTDTRRWQPVLLAYVWLAEVEHCRRFLPDVARTVVRLRHEEMTR
jgi:5-methylcytosine-specific restriction endonuclease McrA